jgi:uncharacterized membrane protein (DUF106 family)
VSQDEVVALYALMGVLVTAVVSIVAVVLTGKQKALTAMVSALQDEVESLREQVGNNETRIQRLERRDRQWADYVHVLRRHINDQKPPPPPEWPAGLDR